MPTRLKHVQRTYRVTQPRKYISHILWRLKKYVIPYYYYLLSFYGFIDYIFVNILFPFHVTVPDSEIKYMSGSLRARGFFLSHFHIMIRVDNKCPMEAN